MKHLTDNPMAARLRAAMDKYLADPRHEEPTFTCHECQDTGFVYNLAGETRRCQGGHCRWWGQYRNRCAQLAEKRKRRGREPGEDEVPF